MGHEVSLDTRKKISEANKGKIINEKTRLAVIESNKRRAKKNKIDVDPHQNVELSNIKF